MEMLETERKMPLIPAHNVAGMFQSESKNPIFIFKIQICRKATRIHSLFSNYHNSVHYPLPCLLFKPQLSETGFGFHPHETGDRDRIHHPKGRVLNKGQDDMSRIVIVILIYHRHKPIDNSNLLGS
jgi:hypothetical protein